MSKKKKIIGVVCGVVAVAVVGGYLLLNQNSGAAVMVSTETRQPDRRCGERDGQKGLFHSVLSGGVGQRAGGRRGAGGRRAGPAGH